LAKGVRHNVYPLMLSRTQREVLRSPDREWVRVRRFSPGPLHRFADFDPRTPLVYVISKVTPNTQSGEDGSGDQGTFVAPCGVPEDSHEALYVALINAQAHEALEWVQIDGKPYFDPHTEVGDYVLEGTLTRWLEWKTGKRVVLEEFD